MGGLGPGAAPAWQCGGLRMGSPPARAGRHFDGAWVGYFAIAALLATSA